MTSPRRRFERCSTKLGHRPRQAKKKYSQQSESVRLVICQSDYDKQCNFRNPTNAVGGIRDGHAPVLFCRPGMNDPPTALVGFGMGASNLDCVGGFSKP